MLENCVKEYGLLSGLQSEPFQNTLLLKGDADTCKTVAQHDAPTFADLEGVGFAEDGDRALVEHILDFTSLLLDNASNRSLYSSSGQLGKLLSTNSLTLLKSTLRVALRLAKRFYSSRQRFSSANAQMSAYLQHHYQLDLDQLNRLAAPFATCLTTPQSSPTSAKAKDKPMGRAVPASEIQVSGADLVSILKNADADDTYWHQWTGVAVASHTASPTTPDRNANGSLEVPDPTSPLANRHGSASRSLHGPSRLSVSEGSPSTPSKEESERTTESTKSAASVTINPGDVARRASDEVLKELKPRVPESSWRELSNSVRVVKGLAGDKKSREDLVAVRMLAIANLAYVCGEAQFQQKIGQQDADEPRRLQLAHQLAELVHPPENTVMAKSRDLQTFALWTLEALTRQKTKQGDVFTALSANVNHGILFYVVRKAVAQLATEESLDDAVEEEWREALFGLLNALPGSAPRAGESMMSAGLLDILVELLHLRSRKAERNQWKVLSFLDSFVYNVRDAFQALANAKGLDAIADLTSHTVDSSIASAERGDGIPTNYKTKNTDYQIPFYQQGILRWLFKFIDHTMKHNGGTLHRQLRNLIDSPQLLGALRKVLGNACVYGSNVWSGAVNILSNFIHNEPTSYAVIAEAGLADTFLEAVTGVPLGKQAGDADAVVILPHQEAIQAIPTAFGAICLNENGQKLFLESGALEAFFRIFESPEHLRNFDPDSELPALLGSAFDELVRHHPALKTPIMDTVLKMLQRVVDSCLEKVAKQGVGTKLWLEDKDGKLFVAGGRKALLRNAGTAANDHKDAAGDVEMQNEDDMAASGLDAPASDVVEYEDPKKRPTSTQTIVVVSRFLCGFFQNKSCCQAFLEAGGLEPILDLTTAPCLSYNFDGSLNFESDLTRTVQLVIEEKPHLALPAVIKRIQFAIDDLRLLADYNAASPFFGVFTGSKDQDPTAAVAAEGTKYAKALCVIPTLCRAVTHAFKNQVFTQRTQSNIFYQVNLADMYLSLVENLGRLSSSCAWQEILLQKDMPTAWESVTRAHMMGWDGDPDQVFNILQNLTNSEAPVAASDATPAADGQPANPSGSDEAPKAAVNQNSAQFKNTKILRYLLGQIPDSIAPLFRAMGRILLSRRITDPYQKSNAVRVADQLAASAIHQLRFEAPCSAAAHDRAAYWVVILKTLNQLMTDDAMERPSPQALTLVLHSFKKQGGFAVLDEIMQAFHSDIEPRIQSKEPLTSRDEEMTLSRSVEGIRYLLNFFSRVINSRHVNDASQTQAMTSRSSDRDKPDFFSAAQFIVELRMAVIKPAMRLWESPVLDKMDISLVRLLVGVLCMELEGESESGAFTRSDKLPKRPKLAVKKWQLKSTEVFDRLKDEYGDELAREAMFRCYENPATVRDYCVAQSTHPRATRNPILPDEVQTPVPSLANIEAPTSSAAAGTSSQPNDAVSEPELFPGGLLLDLSEGDDISPSAVPESSDSVGLTSILALDALHGRDSRGNSPAGSARQELVEASQLPEVVTVDDLNDERAKLRDDLIDRCLDIVNAHDDVTFELADLIYAAVSKAAEPKSLREDIGSTLLQSLMSLQIEDEIPTADFEAQAKKIASYAHLLALVLQDKTFYDATLDELKDSFCSLTEFIKVYPDQKTGGATPWIGQVLLILERLLSEDAQPRLIEFNPPAHDDPLEDSRIAELSPPLISQDEKEGLLSAVLEILPHIGKDETLAISVTRVLVILTRERSLAVRLAEKMNLQKLFTMVRQLGSFSNERLQSAFLLSLRHVIEDEETLRQIMRSEIQAMFESRQQRQTDTTAYTRNLSHLVIRDPELFVEITNEKCMLVRYDAKHGPQMLSLKKEEQAAVPAQATNDVAATESEASKSVEPVTESPQKERFDLERVKSHDLKIPVVEHPDGVIHFLLSELLNYREVEDAKINKPEEKPVLQLSTDVEMANLTPTPSQEAGPQRTGAEKDSNAQDFKIDEHSVFVYRCFLLECLTELLSSYNRTKLEFIGYKRRADPQNSTPSKPRSFVLNYLMNNLIPVGFLHHGNSIQDKKQLVTSNWATQVVVAICNKTGERGFSKLPRDITEYQEEPDLLFVRKFVLEHALRTFRDAHCSSERVEMRYSRLLCLADLFSRMLSGKSPGNTMNNTLALDMQMASHRMLAKIMFEKKFIPALTSSIAEIDLNFPDAKRVVKYILRPLKMLTQTAVDLSLHSDIALQAGEQDEDDISSASSSLSDFDDVREETPDLFRNSALGILDPRRDEEESSSEEEGDDDMFDEEFVDEMEMEMEMEYEDDDLANHDAEEVVSEDEDEIEIDGMPIEGMPGDVNMMPEEDDDSDSEGDDDSEDSESDSDDDEMDEDDDDDDDMDLEEIDEDGAVGIPGADDEDWGTEEETPDGYIDDEQLDNDDDPESHHHLDDIVRVLDPEGRALLERLEDGPDFGLDQGEEDYLDDEGGDEGLYRNCSLDSRHELIYAIDEDEEEYDEEDIVYEPDVEGETTRHDISTLSQLTRADDEDLDIRPTNLPWGTWEEGAQRVLQDHRYHHHHHHGRLHPWGLFGMPGGGNERLSQTYRSHRTASTRGVNDDGTNPLLQRRGRNGPGPSRRRDADGANDWALGDRPGRFPTSAAGGGGPAALISNLLNMMTQAGPAALPPGGTLHLHIDGNMPVGPQILQQFTAGGPPGIDAMFRVMRGIPRPQDHQPSMRPQRDDPNSAVAFNPSVTTVRWMEESRILFGATAAEKAQLVINAVLRLLVPPAREAQKQWEKEDAERTKKMHEEREAKKAKEEQERKEREELEELAAKEEKEREERYEREDRELAEAEAKAREEEAQAVELAESSTQAMEGVEQTQDNPEASSSATEPPVERLFTEIRGQRVEITGLGIDPEFLEGIPEDMREEVLMAQAVQAGTRQPSSAAQQPISIPADFLEQLPPEIREELVQQQASERRHREREEARRTAVTAGAPVHAEEMDTASFFATLDPALRQSLLMDADEDTLAALPAELAAEARALGADRRLHHFADPARLARRHGIVPGTAADVSGGDEHTQKKSRPVVQILDKPGVATLLRLMFVPQQGSAKVSLNGILRDICANKQNRAEVVSILLSILSDGSSDVSAVEKSFKSLTLRAKPSSSQKTPQSKASSPEVIVPGDMSPLMVVQQCLYTLAILVQTNKSMADFFLKEHEMTGALKSKSQRKGKGKENKARNYPVNGLLSLLDRKLVIESAPVMEQLANLLANISHPLIALQKRDKEKAEEQGKKKIEAAQEGEPSTASVDATEQTSVDVDMAGVPEPQPAPSEEQTTEVVTSAEEPPKTEEQQTKPEEKKKPRVLEAPPEVPDQNLRLVVGIVAARECSPKTFKDTLTLLTNLSTIPQAKEIFGKELVRQAQELGQVILQELVGLLAQINKAKTSTDVQGMALSRFSHSSSDQAKLLRVITALDYMFDPKRADAQIPGSRNVEGFDLQIKEDILTKLYENDVFTPLWNKLSEALAAIRERGNMFNVATILLPLIEVLMVVCKNTTLKDSPLSKVVPREFSIQSPEPETKMESIFFAFTEEHRKILNDLVRHNPKLMSGSFQLLVKNSKVLEFDNKRNYFHRKLHSRGSELRQPHPSLQLSVHRNMVFHDSFRALYYKKADEFKYGKLNIRFYGEEGVDAGGVTREWFQALAKQMFDANYALFNPVASDRTTFHPNPMSSINPEHLTFFKFIGRIIGKALYEGRVLDCHFSRAVYKQMLGRPVSIKDMETLDLDYYKSLVWMLENDITDIITETFSVESDVFGETMIVDLIENGRDVAVTDDNKHEYVRLVIEHKLVGSVKVQMEHFLLGKYH